MIINSICFLFSQLLALPLNRKTVLEQQKILFDWFEDELKRADQRRLLLANVKTVVFQCCFIVTAGVCIVALQFFVIPYLGYLHMKNDGTNSTAFFSMGLVPWYTGTDGVQFYSGVAYTVVLGYFVVLSYFLDAFVIMNAYVASRLSKLLSCRFEKLKFCKENKREVSKLIKQHQTIGFCIINFHSTFKTFFFMSFIASSLMIATLTFQVFMVSIYAISYGYLLGHSHVKVKKIYVYIQMLQLKQTKISQICMLIFFLLKRLLLAYMYTVYGQLLKDSVSLLYFHLKLFNRRINCLHNFSKVR